MNIQSILATMFALKEKGQTAPPVKRLSAKEAYDKQKAGELILVDVRTSGEWGLTGVPADALRITLQDRDFLKKVMQHAASFDAPIAFICRSGQRSGQAAAQARATGFTDVANVVGGVEGPGGWIVQRLPMTRG